MRWIGCTVLAAGLTTATEANAEVATDRFEPTRDIQLLGLSGIDIATGWVPAGSPIEVSFDLHVEDDVHAELPGDALYDWDAETIHFEGDEDGGVFEIDVGALLDARVRFDLLGNQFESELLGPYDLLALGDVEFTPYLLPGNVDRPAHIVHTTERTEVFNQPLVDAIIASGEFVVDASFDIDVALQCTGIEVVPEQALPTTIQQELTTEPLAAPAAGQDLLATGRLRCQTRSTVIIVLYPSVRVTIGLEDFELAPFELPVPVLTDNEAAFDFDALPLLFPAPPPDSSSGGGGGTSGATGSTTGQDPPDTDGPVEDTEGDTDSAGAAGPGDAAGCACRSVPRRSLPRGLVVLLALALTTRRARMKAEPSAV